MTQWRHSIEGPDYKALIQSNQMNLEYFETSKVLSPRQAKCEAILSSYYFVIEYLDGKKNPAGGQSRRPDCQIGYERPTA
jgi:hypothetical protein